MVFRDTVFRAILHITILRQCEPRGKIDISCSGNVWAVDACIAKHSDSPVDVARCWFDSDSQLVLAKPAVTIAGIASSEQP